MDFTQISSDVIRGYIDLMILRVLCDGDSYGYEISKSITKLSEGAYTMKETTLYSAFARLEKSGCIHPYPGTYSGGRERTYYNLTEFGRQHYRQKCTEWELTKELIKNFILEDNNYGSNQNLY
jgi:PadR family transcriptional regulator PadR